MAQDECEYTPGKKAAKLLEQANDRKKYKSDQRREFLEKALDDEENCLPCMMKLGESEFRIAKKNRSSFGLAEKYFLDLTELCKDYHSSPYYYLGAMSYANQDYEKALEYFDYFLHFPDDSPEKYEKNYEKKYAEVEEVIPFVEFYKDFFANEGTMQPSPVAGVNSEKNEYLPALSPDSEIMFYTRTYLKKAKGDIVGREVEEFTWSNRADLNSTFDGGEALPAPFNLGDNYGGASISVDNKELFIAKKTPVEGNADKIDNFVTRYELSYSEKEGKEVYQWSELESLGDAINTDSGWESQPSLSGDGKTLYFATVRAETQKEGNENPDTDIYYSERQDDGSWSDARPVEGINTPFQDKSPFMHSDSHTLYFASDRQPGGGGYDLWYTRQQKDGTWSRPRNIGAPINTDQDEHGMIVSSDGDKAYYASRNVRGSRGMDIYSFELPEEAKPEKVMILKGQVSSNGGDIPQDAQLELNYIQSKETQTIEIAKDDGRYAAVVSLERSEDVVVELKGEDVAFNAHLIVDKEEEEQPDVIKMEIEERKIEKSTPFLIPDIFYRTNSSDINRESKLILDQFAEYLLENPSLSIEIRGHTDDKGSDSDNLALSMDRAFEVKGYLESKGISGKRIKAQGYGESKPIADNNSAAGQAKNRRTEFVIISL
ncbi:MAG: OmpA family protein [Bacteroidota bacterium]